MVLALLMKNSWLGLKVNVTFSGGMVSRAEFVAMFSDDRGKEGFEGCTLFDSFFASWQSDGEDDTRFETREGADTKITMVDEDDVDYGRKRAAGQ